MRASAQFTATVYLWKPDEFPQDVDDSITAAFQEAEEMLKHALHQLHAVKKVRVDY